MNSVGDHDFWDDVPTVYRTWESPLSPSRQDLDIMLREVGLVHHRIREERLRVLQLGVTPKLALMDWPARTNLVAVDRCPTMIRELWPGDVANQVGPNRRVVQDDWRSMHVDGRPFHLVIGDGPFHNMPDAENYEILRDAVDALLADAGRVIVRFFVQPPIAEDPLTLVQRMHAGQFPSFHAFKFCLLMALQSAPDRGVVLHDVWDFWQSLNISHLDLAATQHWPAAAIDTIHAYRGQTNRLCFLTQQKIVELLSERFTILRWRRPTYFLGDRCPILVAERNQ